MFNGFYKLVTWSTLLSLIVVFAMVIADTYPGIDAFVARGLSGLWLGTSTALFMGSIIIYIVSIIAHKIQNEPPDYDIGPYIRRSFVIGLFFLMAIHTAATHPITIPLDDIFAFMLGSFLGLILSHMIMLGALMWGVGIVETVVHLMVDRIMRIRPMKQKNSPLEWDIPQ